MWVLSLCFGFGHFASQSFKCTCVERRHTLCAFTNSDPQSCYVFTALWYGCFVVTLTFYLHQTQFWLWLVWANSPVFTHQGMNKLTSQHNGTNKARTPPYSYPQYCGHTCQVCEYPDSTTSKALVILKWQTITTLNMKLLKKQRV